MLPVKYGLTVFRVGGVVSESSHKFFIQFVFYTAIFCGFNLVVLSIFTAELRQVRAVAALFTWCSRCSSDLNCVAERPRECTLACRVGAVSGRQNHLVSLHAD